MRQSGIFFDGEGDNYFQRNVTKPLNENVVKALTSIPSKPDFIMEIGCGDGRYLNVLHEKYDCRCVGYDPSRDAITHGRKTYKGINLIWGNLNKAYNTVRVGSVDVLIFGFCLYLFDRDDLFHTVAMADEMLAPGGHLVIYDFDVDEPSVTPYKHCHNVMSYKMDYSDLWLANPAYYGYSKSKVGPGECVSILKKDTWDAYAVTAQVVHLTPHNNQRTTR